jgi:hypothetical protein
MRDNPNRYAPMLAHACVHDDNMLMTRRTYVGPLRRFRQYESVTAWRLLRPSASSFPEEGLHAPPSRLDDLQDGPGHLPFMGRPRAVRAARFGAP